MVQASMAKSRGLGMERGDGEGWPSLLCCLETPVTLALYIIVCPGEGPAMFAIT